MKLHQITRLDSEGPIRPLKNSRRAITGKLPSASGNRIQFESALEGDWFACLDFDPSVRVIREQPFSLFYMLDGVRRRYTPDALVERFSEFLGPSTTVYEVKLREDLHANWHQYRPRFKAAIHHCRRQGWQFKIVTEREIRTPFLKNVRFLRRYRQVSPQPLVEKQLFYTMTALGQTTPQALLAASYINVETQMTALPELWRLVANRKIVAMLDQQLTMHSPIWLPEK